MKEGIKVEVKYTDGYERRFTEACLNQIRKRGKTETPLGNNQERKTA